MAIRYYSTNKKSKTVSFVDALLSGQAPDGGLYMPGFIPEFTHERISSFKDKSYSEIAYSVMYEFLKGKISPEYLKIIVDDAYDFPVPIELIDDHKYLLYLDRGPTAAFKDFAARMISRLMSHFLNRSDQSITLLVATSGDTGGAVADAFYGHDNVNVVILFPKNEVSISQRKQMTTLGKNIIAVAVTGKFDDCQAIVKRAFIDPELQHLSLTTANSINIGRLLPQIIYYFYAYSRIIQDELHDVIFSVPSGNFGNLMGGIMAKKMGLPVKKFIAAVNKNDAFPSFLNTEHYNPISPSINCLSNAMNVGHPSNLARLFDIYNGQINETGHINKMPDLKNLREDIHAVSISDETTKKAIKNVYEKYKLILEPHGAVAWAGMQDYLMQNDDTIPVVVIETAHPSKFPESLEKLDIFPEIHPNLQEVVDNVEVDYPEINDYEEFITYAQSM